MTTDIRIGIIGGSGLGDAIVPGLDAQDARIEAVETPFGPPSAPIMLGTYDNAPIAVLLRHGPGHVLPPSRVPYRANIYALKALGCTHIIASGATGSLREEVHPGELMICDQLIDRTDGRVRTFYEQAAVHVEFGDPFCPVMRRWLIDRARALPETTVHDHGVYVCVEGPSFSTRAESHLYRTWGADVVGMTALPEARLAREAEMAYTLIALPTDYDCWRPRDVTDESSLLTEIIGNLNRATTAAIELVKTALADITPLRDTPSPAHDALRLAIWSERSAIPAEDIERLDVLWGRHFAKNVPSS